MDKLINLNVHLIERTFCNVYSVIAHTRTASFSTMRAEFFPAFEIDASLIALKIKVDYICKHH
jgi:hypothetical protein